MKIAVIGAAGNVGSRVVAEALRRGHHVTPLTRTDLEATDIRAVTDAVTGHDASVGTTRVMPGREAEGAEVTRALLRAHAAAGVRFLMVGGAGSLHAPGDDRMLAEDRRWVPARIADLARSAIDQLDACRRDPDTDWTYVAPSARMEPGPRTGCYRIGADELLVGPDGHSYVSMEDLAVAVVDEIEDPRHRRRQFTVATVGTP